MLLGEDAGDLRRGDVAAVDEDLAEALAGGLLVAERLLELLDGEGAVAQEKRSERGPGMCCCFHFAPVIGRERGDMRLNRTQR